MSTTKIEWADMTINPVVGCSKCSPGCDNCYAERQAARLVHMPQTAAKYAGVVDAAGKWTGKINGLDVPCGKRTLHQGELDLYCFNELPKTPKRIFCGSMCDMFHPNVCEGDLCGIFVRMTHLKRHTFMVLTKRPNRMLEYMGNRSAFPIPNLWLGVTVCNQQEAEEKIPVLLQTPAAKRFVSIEPMLEAINLQAVYPHDWMHCKVCGWYGPDDGQNGADHKGNETDGFEQICPTCGNDGTNGEFDWTRDCAEAYHETILPGLDWVICGGETGPKARPMHPDWVRSLRDQCTAAGVPFFFKGWGEWGESHALQCNERGIYGKMWHNFDPDTSVCRTGKARAGRLLDGVEHSEVPACPNS